MIQLNGNSLKLTQVPPGGLELKFFFFFLLVSRSDPPAVVADTNPSADPIGLFPVARMLRVWWQDDRPRGGEGRAGGIFNASNYFELQPRN